MSFVKERKRAKQLPRRSTLSTYYSKFLNSTYYKTTRVDFLESSLTKPPGDTNVTSHGSATQEPARAVWIAPSRTARKNWVAWVAVDSKGWFQFLFGYPMSGRKKQSPGCERNDGWKKRWTWWKLVFGRTFSQICSTDPDSKRQLHFQDGSLRNQWKKILEHPKNLKNFSNLFHSKIRVAMSKSAEGNSRTSLRPDFVKILGGLPRASSYFFPSYIVGNVLFGHFFLCCPGLLFWVFYLGSMLVSFSWIKHLFGKEKRLTREQKSMDPFCFWCQSERSHWFV